MGGMWLAKSVAQKPHCTMCGRNGFRIWEGRPGFDPASVMLTENEKNKNSQPLRTIFLLKSVASSGTMQVSELQLSLREYRICLSASSLCTFFERVWSVWVHVALFVFNVSKQSKFLSSDLLVFSAKLC